MDGGYVSKVRGGRGGHRTQTSNFMNYNYCMNYEYNIGHTSGTRTSYISHRLYLGHPRSTTEKVWTAVLHTFDETVCGKGGPPTQS